MVADESMNCSLESTAVDIVKCSVFAPDLTLISYRFSTDILLCTEKIIYTPDDINTARA